MYSCATSFWRQQLFGQQTFGTHRLSPWCEVNYGGVQLGRSDEVSLPQIQWNWCVFSGGGMNFIHFGWDDFGWLCLCVCFKSMSDHVSAAYHEVRYMEPQVPHVREFQRTSSDIFNSDNMSSCVARSPSYTCSKAIPQNLWSIRKQHSEGFSCRCYSVQVHLVHIELSVWFEQSARNCLESDPFPSFLCAKFATKAVS